MTKMRRSAWMKLIDEWMGLNKRGSLDWKSVLALEGGYGAGKIKSVEEAMLPENEGTWPGIWFQSAQLDYSVYGRYDYVYSLLFGRQISAGSIALVKREIEATTEKAIVMDWGGSIYTSVDLLDSPGIMKVILVNFKSPQLEFAKWARDRLELKGKIVVGDEDTALGSGPHPHADYLVMSEVLEHIDEPVEYFNKVTNIHGLNMAFIASSFCTPAYGHHIPIMIDGLPYNTPRKANKAWRKAMIEAGWSIRKIKGWNSRLYFALRKAAE